MSPACSERSSRSRTRVSIRADPVSPSAAISSRGQVLEPDHPGADRVVDVVVDVGDPVDNAHDPSLQRRRRAVAGVVEDAVADLSGEVEPLPVALEALDHPQRVLVVAKAHAVALLQAVVEHVLADVPEGRVPEVVAEADRLRQVLVESQRALATLRAIPHASSVCVSRVR